jgi:hypothetical protein
MISDAFSLLNQRQFDFLRAKTPHVGQLLQSFTYVTDEIFRRGAEGHRQVHELDDVNRALAGLDARDIGSMLAQLQAQLLSRKPRRLAGASNYNADRVLFSPVQGFTPSFAQLVST